MSSTAEKTRNGSTNGAHEAHAPPSGRNGLGAITHGPEPAAADANGRVVSSGPIPIKLIDPSPLNPRKTFDPAKLEELAASIRVHGVLQPVLLRPCMGKSKNRTSLIGNGRYELVAGERRFRAAQLAELTVIPATVRNLTDKEVLEIAVIENEQREDVSPIEKAEGYRALIEQHGYTVEDLAAKVGKSPATIYALLKLLNLPDKARKAVADGTLPASTAQLIGRLPSEGARKDVTAYALKPNWQGHLPSFRDVREVIERDHMIELKQAPFRQDDAQLVPAAGSCKACPKRTGNDRANYPDARADVCTDPACYRTKLAAYQERLRTEAATTGQKVLSAAESKKLFPYSDALQYNAPYFELKAKCYEDSKGRTYKQLLGDDVEIVTAFDPQGRPHHLVHKDVALPHLKKAGVGKDRFGMSAKTTDEEKKERAKRMLDNKITRETDREVLAQVATRAKTLFDGRTEDPKCSEILRCLCRDVSERVWGDRLADILAGYGCHDAKGPGDMLDALDEKITAMQGPELIGLMAACVVAHGGLGQYASGDEAKQLLTLVAVDRKAIEKAARERIKTEMTAKKAAKKGGKSPSANGAAAPKPETAKSAGPEKAEDLGVSYAELEAALIRDQFSQSRSGPAQCNAFRLGGCHYIAIDSGLRGDRCEYTCLPLLRIGYFTQHYRSETRFNLDPPAGTNAHFGVQVAVNGLPYVIGPDIEARVIAAKVELKPSKPSLKKAGKKFQAGGISIVEPAAKQEEGFWCAEGCLRHVEVEGQTCEACIKEGATA